MNDDYSTFTDEELVGEVLKNSNMYAVLMERYQDKLSRYIRRRAKVTREDTEDLLQDIFIKVYKNLNEFDTDLKFSSWIYRIAHNEVISWYRKHKKVFEGNLESDATIFDTISADLDIEKDLNREELRVSINEAVKKLDEHYREIIMLRFFEEKDYREISDILEIPEGTVGIRLNRAKKQLSKLLEEHL